MSHSQSDPSSPRRVLHWKVESLAWFQPPASLVEIHYDFLKGRPFFPWLIDFMTALPLLVGRVTAAADALERMRYELGETRIAQSRPGSLTRLFTKTTRKIF